MTASPHPAPNAVRASAVTRPELVVAALEEKDDSAHWAGELIAGKYRVEKVIGKGGMGVVLGARHVALDEPVAIKVLRPQMMEVAGMVARFVREARAASKIKSEHVARVTDVDQLPSGVPYMVMEYLEGIDLAALRRKTGPLPVEETVDFVAQASEAIAEAHALGIVHRDLKPANLFLAQRRDGRRTVKVLDFGISKIESPGEDTTKTGTMLGSPKYMSPEQMMSKRDVDGRADIWALGAIMYELCTGRPPFLADSTPQICALVLNADPAPPRSLRPEIPEGMEAIILRCLEKSPEKRFASVGELVRALGPFGPPALQASLGSSTALLATPKLDATPRPGPTATPTPAEASSPVTPLGTAVDTAMAFGPEQKRFPAGAVLGGLALVLAIGTAAMVYTREDPQVSVHSLTQASTAAPVITEAPAITAAPAATPTATASATASATAAPAGELPAEVKRLGPLPGKKPKAGTTADPFGGSRN